MAQVHTFLFSSKSLLFPVIASTMFWGPSCFSSVIHVCISLNDFYILVESGVELHWSGDVMITSSVMSYTTTAAAEPR